MPGRVVLRSLGKRFRRLHKERPLSIKDTIFQGFRGLGHDEVFWALHDIDLEVEAGATVGLFGHNGAGKSTLLRLVGGIGRPDVGHIHVQGRITGLLDLGAGFHPDLSGRENVFVNGVIAGLTRREIQQRLDAIVEWAELGDFIDSPLHTYSRGMRQRLGFSVSTHTDPDVLLIDEMLAVGDKHFHRKCLERISEIKASGCAVLLATHQLDAIREQCDRAVQLRGGEIVDQGAADAVVDRYEATREAGMRPAAIAPAPPTAALEA